MEFSLPEFPADPGAQAAFLATAFLGLVAILLMVAPGPMGWLMRLEPRGARIGGNNEFRTGGAFVAGLTILALLFDQPVAYAAIGVGLIGACLGRLLSLILDREALLANIVVLLIQAALAYAFCYHLAEIVDSEMQILMPSEFSALLVFLAYWGFVMLGLVLAFTPRPLAMVSGLVTEDSEPLRLASLRAAGGFLIGLGLAGLMFANPMVELVMVGALVLAVFGRLAGLLAYRRNLGFKLVALIVQILFAAIFANYISAMI